MKDDNAGTKAAEVDMQKARQVAQEARRISLRYSRFSRTRVVLNMCAHVIEMLAEAEEFGVNANQDLLCELEMANAYIDDLRNQGG